MCGLCHTEIDRTGIYNVDGAFLAGGMRVGDYPHGFSVSRNLTSDVETGLVQCATRRPSAGPGAQSVRDVMGAFSQLHERRRDGDRNLP